MATVKTKLYVSSGHDYGRIYYQIIHGRKTRRITSAHTVALSDWSETRSAVSAGPCRSYVRADVLRINHVIKALECRDMPYTADDVVDDYKSYLVNLSLEVFMSRIIKNMKAAGKIRTAETYRSALGSFLRFMDGEVPMLDAFTPALMEKYETYLTLTGLVPNSVSFYMRILRAVYNRAVASGLVVQNYPFRSVYTGIDKTVKRAVSLPVLRKIKALDLSESPKLEYARDMFLMSFYLRGMSFVDMAYLRKGDLRAGYVCYRRRKTGQLLMIKWTGEMRDILRKYPDSSAGYLLPIILRPNVNERCAYRNAGYAINFHLKHIAAMVGLAIPLTLYVARHTWASVAKMQGVPISVISQGMGHDSETTTQIYLASLDTSVVDKANAKIISSLK